MVETCCPECGGSRIVKDGLRQTSHSEVQRFYCKDCGYRFSLNPQRVQIPPPAPPSTHRGEPFPENETNVSIFATCLKPNINQLKANQPTVSCQVCASEGEVKNLSQQRTRKKQVAGATEITDAIVKGKIIEYTWWMQKKGLKLSTIKTRTEKIQRLARLGADMFNPDNVKDVIARQSNWGDGHKHNMVVAYTGFLEMLDKTWEPPIYRIPESFPFIPLESEIDALINGCGKKIACFLQGLKDTGADPGELARLEWTDINIEAKSVTIRHPVKRHNPRVIHVSDAFLRRLNAMPKNGPRVFCTVRGLRSNFTSQRRCRARELSNPRILKITFITFRHWKGTMEYHKTKDIIHVKQLLGHKCIQSTMIYINLEAALFQAESDEFTVRVAKTLDEACSLVEAGFDYVTDMEDSKIFRHRK